MSKTTSEYRALVGEATNELGGRLSIFAMTLAVAETLIEKGILTKEDLDNKVKQYNQLQYKELANGSRVYENEEGYANIKAAPVGAEGSNA
jgi:hypothetical protein